MMRITKLRDLLEGFRFARPADRRRQAHRTHRCHECLPHRSGRPFSDGNDRPGSPNIQVDLAHLPIYATLGESAGVGERFNRLEVTLKGGARCFSNRLSSTSSTESNDDRNYN
jgi:hypothetical protein